ncbi:hypothetical protein Taro_046948 [Colocasia esculenta]|uniref:Plantacyanin n=1 Tax=Colocasia esculenta TaxID=4460 RepID=A0A843WTW1_COLES|nr:hypothetical protein [Colocasia esculenta]
MAMSQGRSSAGAAKALLIGFMVVLLCLVIQTEAATFTVGDAGGWTFGASGWPAGKHFQAGDQLVFRYDPSMHNVAVVDAAGYNSCSLSPGWRVLSSGNDVITLSRGTNFFFCPLFGHCGLGQKMAITAN